MRIFITNDDGIQSPGIKTLVDFMKDFGEVVVVAPDKPMSGVGHAISMREPIRTEAFDGFENVEAYSCSGTPADCVKYAMGHVLSEQMPDLLLSGINHGSNASVNLLYSGTVAAAVEGCLYGIPSIAISHLSHDENANLDACLQVLEDLLKNWDRVKPGRFDLLNINVPDVEPENVKGYKFCQQALGYWREEFQEATTQDGKPAFWLRGVFECYDKHEETDIWALENNYTSVVPVHLNLTSTSYYKKLKSYETSMIKS